MNILRLFLSVLVLVAVLCTLHVPMAHAIKLTLKRIVFEGSKRAEVLTLINDSDEEQTYRLGWRNMSMKDGKSLSPVEEGEHIPGFNPADQMVVFAPRRITIPAGGSQQVRLMLRKPADLVDGEYRSHLWIRPEEEAVKFTAPGAGAQEGAEITTSIQIKMLAGVNFPILVRHGKTDASATITNPKVTPQGEGSLVTFDLNREGNRSLYGDFRFSCLLGDADEVFYEIKGLAVYTETTTRQFEFKLPTPKSGTCRTLRIVYLGAENDLLFPGKTIAATNISLP